jgi:hypothetical protein
VQDGVGRVDADDPTTISAASQARTDTARHPSTARNASANTSDPAVSLR